MQLTTVVRRVSNQSLHEQLGFYRCFNALPNSLQNKLAVYVLHARPIHAISYRDVTLHERAFCCQRALMLWSLASTVTACTRMLNRRLEPVF